ncbi:thermonuclease family protein [Chthonobacter rhizosphaerae]|uniref:thermonuclease family protein n=1 Tax=Chthonobacter rhizosphaerae TaxID=2735553 RepID=UPI0015EEDEE4|nr:thermonuclease family protein [Chthonobacter rhizosphaerae]
MTWGVPLLAGPAVTALGLLALTLTLAPPDLSDLSEMPAFVADANADGALRVAAADPPPSAPAAETPAPVRNVTPPGVTPGPAVSGPLKRVKPAERAIPRPQDQPADRYTRVVVLDAGHFRVVSGSDALVVSVAGIVAPAFDEMCTDGDGVEWKCGARARAELARLIGGRSVGCTTVDDTEPRAPVARCSVGNRDLASWLVENGWAEPDGSRVELIPLATTARDQKRGRHGSAPHGIIAG